MLRRRGLWSSILRTKTGDLAQGQLRECLQTLVKTPERCGGLPRNEGTLQLEASSTAGSSSPEKQSPDLCRGFALLSLNHQSTFTKRCMWRSAPLRSCRR